MPPDRARPRRPQGGNGPRAGLQHLRPDPRRFRHRDRRPHDGRPLVVADDQRPRPQTGPGPFPAKAPDRGPVAGWIAPLADARVSTHARATRGRSSTRTDPERWLEGGFQGEPYETHPVGTEHWVHPESALGRRVNGDRPPRSSPTQPNRLSPAGGPSAGHTNLRRPLGRPHPPPAPAGPERWRSSGDSSTSEASCPRWASAARAHSWNQAGASAARARSWNQAGASAARAHSWNQPWAAAWPPDCCACC